jgi:hypothetical protein
VAVAVAVELEALAYKVLEPLLVARVVLEL